MITTDTAIQIAATNNLLEQLTLHYDYFNNADKAILEISYTSIGISALKMNIGIEVAGDLLKNAITAAEIKLDELNTLAVQEAQDNPPEEVSANKTSDSME